MATFDPSKYVDKTFDYGQNVLDPLKATYGLTDSQIRGLTTSGGINLGDSGYYIRASKDGAGYTIKSGSASPAPAPAPTAPRTATPAAPVPQTAPAAPAPTSVGQAGQAAQTYSNNPGGAPSQNTTNQGTQDVLRNTYLQRVLQPTQIDANDPNIRQQSDAYGAAMERARRDQLANQAEQFSAQGLTGSGAETAEGRLINERAAQGRAGFEAELVGNEMQRRRDEINDALTNLGDMLSQDQARALEKELANLDAQIKRMGIQSTESLGRAELRLKELLGKAGLDLDKKRLGFDIGRTQADLNQRALLSLLGG